VSKKPKKQEQPQRRVLILGGDSLYRLLLRELNLDIVSVKTISQLKEEMPNLDLVMFTGGADVNPVRYGGVHTNVSFITPERDEIEEVVFNLCLKHGVKMTGICRGFQFLNVMCGGKMYQHINNHGGVYHEVLYPTTGKISRVTSTHHQLVMLPDNAIPVAWAYPINMSNIYIGPNAQVVEDPDHEMESAIFPEYNTFGVQFHPESHPGPHDSVELFDHFVEKLR